MIWVYIIEANDDNDAPIENLRHGPYTDREEAERVWPMITWEPIALPELPVTVTLVTSGEYVDTLVPGKGLAEATEIFLPNRRRPVSAVMMEQDIKNMSEHAFLDLLKSTYMRKSEIITHMTGVPPSEALDYMENTLEAIIPLLAERFDGPTLPWL